MSGKPAARQGDAVVCPRCGENQIASGSPDVLFNGLPAARQGDCTTCGAALNVRVVPNVLINGQPAVVMGSHDSHGGVVIGGSATVLIGEQFSPAMREPIADVRDAAALQPAPASPAAERTGQAAAPAREALEEEEEEEEDEREERAAVGITLRIGVFFDGTGNNAANTMSGQACGAQHPITPQDLAAGCMPYMREPDGSYGNDFSNIKKLSELYPRLNGVASGGQRQMAVRGFYVEGIGTQAGEKDSLISSATGRGDTGVLGRVQQAFKHIAFHVDHVIQENPGSEITSLVFDIFGFSRGAAAARHFANEIARGHRGPLRALLSSHKQRFSGDFQGQYKHDIDVGFIGLFDTVAAVAGVANLGNVRHAVTPGLQLYLPRSRFSHVVHLVARDEYRANFPLSRVKPDHLELTLPGAHSDIGGGYLPEAEECVFVSPMQALTVGNGTAVTSTSIYRDAWRYREQLIAQGWPAAMLEVVTPPPTLLKADVQDRFGPRQQRLLAVLQLKRVVRGELSRVYLRVMHALAKQKGVPFNDIPKKSDFQLPKELEPLSERFVAGYYHVTPTEEALLRLRYIHTSAHWNHPLDASGQREARVLYINAPAPGGVRIQHPHVPS